MRYDEYLRRGYPIASGVIEGACRHLVKDRMERSGMRWTLEGARSMLKAWSALWLPEAGRWKDHRHTEKFKLLKMEFRTFVNTIIRIPCQIVTTGRRTVYRLLAWNDSQPIFWRMVEVLNL